MLGQMLILFALPILLTTPLLAETPLAIPDFPAYPPDKAIPVKVLSNFTFDVDNEGWRESFVGLPGSSTRESLYDATPADYSTVNGVPPGSIFEQVTGNINKRAYWLSHAGTPQFLGDLSDASLTCAVYSTSNWETLANGAFGDDGNVYARWLISSSCAPNTSDTFLSLRAASINLNSFTGWQNFSVPLVASNFFRWPNLSCNTRSFDQVLVNYDQLGLVIFSGTDNIENINGGIGTWGVASGFSRLLHYGAFATVGDGLWGVDNFHAEGSSVAIENTTFGHVKALFQ